MLKLKELERLKEKIESLTPEERKQVTEDFCNQCGFKIQRGFRCGCEDGEDE